jgi:hypothetical protein
MTTILVHVVVSQESYGGGNKIRLFDTQRNAEDYIEYLRQQSKEPPNYVIYRAPVVSNLQDAVGHAPSLTFI